jgi:uncharacterized low-complexity protein
MKSLKSRLSAAALLAVIAILVAAAAPSGPAREPDKLIILSTTDVKGKTGPCG